MPDQAKSRIVVLGNWECHDWSKSDCFSPVLWFDSLRFLVSLAVHCCRGLKQGDCKNAFCQGILPPDEVTIVCLPSGDLDAHKKQMLASPENTLQPPPQPLSLVQTN
jgi:hypothetical protein